MQMIGNPWISYIQVLVGATPWRFESSRAYVLFNQEVPELRGFGIFCWVGGAFSA